MSEVTNLHLREPLARQRLIAADLIAQREDAWQKAEHYTRCFSDMEALIASLSGAKRPAFRVRFRALQSELKAAVDELMILERQLLDIRGCLAAQATAPSTALSLPANVAGPGLSCATSPSRGTNASN